MELMNLSGGDWSLVLVNAAHPITYEPNVVDTPMGKPCDERIAPIVQAMFEDAKKDGVILLMRSAYRSVEYQERLYQNKIQRVIYEEGVDPIIAPNVAATVVARPGTSEHHTGLALDILCPEHDILDEGFFHTKAFEWLRSNAQRYGFILRYEKHKQPITGIIFEPWHWRFVGTSAAKVMNEKGFCLEEYLSFLLKERLNACK